jgi:hypothetical protein
LLDLPTCACHRSEVRDILLALVVGAYLPFLRENRAIRRQRLLVLGGAKEEAEESKDVLAAI